VPDPTLRAMREADLDLIRAWMGEPHIAKWYLSGSTLEGELDDLRRCVAGEEPTHALIVVENGRDVGWCQWYRCADYPEHAVAVGAEAHDVGVDYAIGDPASIGRGLGSSLIAALVAHIRRRHPRAGLIADPDAGNFASRRVLEKNGFKLADVRVMASEPTRAPMAIYRLAPETCGGELPCPGSDRRQR
jgi:aminoglycoside 6'-N-acetyltransferase